jgi:hypothetical protein
MSDSSQLRPEQFRSSLEAPPVELENGETGLDPRAVSGFWLYEACQGNQKALVLVLDLITQANPLLNATQLLQRCQQGEDAAIQQAIALMATQLNVKLAAAFEGR